MSSELTSKEVADRIGVSMSTLKNWAVRLPVPSVLGPDGTRRFPEEALAVLEAVKQLRDDERSYATIRRAITFAPEEVGDEAPSALAGTSPARGEEGDFPVGELGVPTEFQAPDVIAPSALEVTVTLEPPPTPDTVPGEAAVAMVTQVLQVLREETALAEAYATARQRVGELEAQVKMLHEDKLRLQQELSEARRLAAPREVSWAPQPWYRRLKTYLFP